MKSKTTQNRSKGFQLYLSKPFETLKTFYLILTWIVLGIQLELVGPTLNILAQNTSVSYEKISRILMSRSAGYLLINILGAFAQNLVKKYPELILSLAFFLASFIVFFTPRIDDLLLLSMGFFFQGISQGSTDLGGTNLMLTMWKDDVSAPLNLVHLGFGIGAVVGNFLIKPHLPSENYSTTNSTLLVDENFLLERQLANRSIRYPYAISSAICFFIALGHLIIFIYEIVRQNRSELDVDERDSSSISRRIDEKTKFYSPRSCGYGSFHYGLLMSTFWIIYMFFLSGNDQTFGKFFFSYLKSPQFSISNAGATWGMILFWSSYSLGRLICALITSFYSVHYVLNGLWICGLILALTWGLFVWVIQLKSQTLFILGSLTGLVFSPTFPLSFAYLNQRLNVNPFLLGFILCGGSLGAILFQSLGGIILDQNPDYFPTLLIICVILSIIFYLFASILSRNFFKKRDEEAKNLSSQNRSEEEKQMEEYLSTTNSND